MQVEFTTASRRHRLGRAHVRFVMSTQGERGWKYVGPDDRGLELEVIAVELDSGDFLVIHAMPTALRGGGG